MKTQKTQWAVQLEAECVCVCVCVCVCGGGKSERPHRCRHGWLNQSEDQAEANIQSAREKNADDNQIRMSSRALNAMLDGGTNAGVLS